MKYKERIKRIVLLFLLVSSFFLLHGETENSSFTIIAGKDATHDNSIIISHNEDAGGKNTYVNILKRPGNKQQKSWGTIWIDIPGVAFSDSYMNEKGVVITSNFCPSRETRPQLTSGGIGFKLRRIMVDQATSARHAVEIAGKLILKYGYSSSGASYAIADANEAWLLQIVKGKHWVAKRVQDDQIAVVANCFTIDTVDFNDKENYKGSADLINYAVKRGWYDPKKEEPFHFAKAYALPAAYSSEANILRQWRGTALLAKNKYKIDEPLPFSFKPRKKIKITNLFMVMRDHYEGTEYDLTRGYKEGSPNKTEKRTICTQWTRYSFVAQLRPKMLPELSNVVWIALCRPDSNAYSPWYFSITDTPEGYAWGESKTSWLNKISQPDPKFRDHPHFAYWEFQKLAGLVDQNYRAHIKMARKEWRNFENYALKRQKKIEKEFTYFLKKNKHVALKLITNYVRSLEYRKWFHASDLIERLQK
jgi:dipeptidase